MGQNSFPDVAGFKKFKGQQYGRAPDAWLSVVRPGDVAVIDANGARDTDEMIKVKKIPVYCKNGYSTRGVRPGRLIAESYNFPISCGGVLVFPGDVIVADGDGVLVVPRQRALEVGRLAHEIYIGDEQGRMKRLQELGNAPR